MPTWLPWLLVPVTYLLGSVSFAYLAGRLKGIDLRQHGSGNLGATNAGRVLGKGWFFAVFSLDLLKGFAPVLVAQELIKPYAVNPPLGLDWLPLATAAAAILGHSFTCLHGFKGGKAVATSLGVLIALVFQVAVITFAVWLVIWTVGLVAFGKKAAEAVGPASVIAAIAAPVARQFTIPEPWRTANLPVTIFILIVACLVVVKHRSNIAKMLKRNG